MAGIFFFCKFVVPYKLLILILTLVVAGKRACYLFIKNTMRTEEHNLQKACITWFRLRYPNYIIFAIPAISELHYFRNSP